MLEQNVAAHVPMPLLIATVTTINANHPYILFNNDLLSMFLHFCPSETNNIQILYLYVILLYSWHGIGIRGLV